MEIKEFWEDLEHSHTVFPETMYGMLKNLKNKLIFNKMLTKMP